MLKNFSDFSRMQIEVLMTTYSVINNLILILFSRNMIPINIPEKKNYSVCLGV